MTRMMKRNVMIVNRREVVTVTVHIAAKTINNVARQVVVRNVALLIVHRVMIAVTVVMVDVVLPDVARVLHVEEVVESRPEVVGARHPEIVARSEDIHKEGVHRAVGQINLITTITDVHRPQKWMEQQPQMDQVNRLPLLINSYNNRKITDPRNNNNHKIQEWSLHFKITSKWEEGDLKHLNNNNNFQLQKNHQMRTPL